MNLRIRSLALVPLVALAVSACGGASEEEYADAISAGLTSAESQPLSGPKSDCVAERFVDQIGGSRLGKAGDPEDLEVHARTLDFSALGLTEPEANELFDDFMDCGADMRSRVLSELGAQDLALPEEMMSCIEDAISEGEMRAFFVPLMRTGQAELDPGVETRMERALGTCVDDLNEVRG